MRTFNTSVNKEWLSLHQCIDINCPVHSLNKSNLQLFECDSPSISHRHDEPNAPNIAKSDLNNRNSTSFCGSDSQSEPRQTTGHSSLRVDVICDEYIGGLKQVTKHYSDEKKTVKQIDGIEKIKHEYEKNATAEDTKSNFICTWLRENVDINKFPFYKKAVNCENQRILRKDFAVYSAFATDVIWTRHEYIGVPESNSRPPVLSSTVKAVNSHESLFESVDKLLRSISDVNISDLKLKYAFLFSNDFNSKYTNHCTEDKYPYVDRSRKLQASFGIQSFGNIRAVTECNAGDIIYDERMETCNNNANNICAGLCNSNKLPNTNTLPNCVTAVPVYQEPMEQHKSVTSHQCYITDYDKNLHESEKCADRCFNDLLSSTVTPDGGNEYTRTYDSPATPYTTDHEFNQSNIPYERLSKNPRLLELNSSEECHSPYSLPRLSPFTYGNTQMTNACLNVSPFVSSPTYYHYMSPLQNQTSFTEQKNHFFTKRTRDPRIQTKTSPENLIEVERIIPELKSRGYDVVPLGEESKDFHLENETKKHRHISRRGSLKHHDDVNLSTKYYRDHSPFRKSRGDSSVYRDRYESSLRDRRKISSSREYNGDSNVGKCRDDSVDRYYRDDSRFRSLCDKASVYRYFDDSSVQNHCDVRNHSDVAEIQTHDDDCGYRKNYNDSRKGIGDCCIEDEDPLNGFSNYNRRTYRHLSPESNSGSPDSEIFYRINDYQNDKERHADDVMNLFYSEGKLIQNNYFRNHDSTLTCRKRSHSQKHTSNSEPLSASRSPLKFDRAGSREKFDRSRSRAYAYTHSISPRDKPRRSSCRLSEVSRYEKHRRYEYSKDKSEFGSGDRTKRKLDIDCRESRKDIDSSNRKYRRSDSSLQSKRRENSPRHRKGFHRRSVETTVSSVRIKQDSKYKGTDSRSCSYRRRSLHCHGRRDRTRIRLNHRR